MTQEIRAKQEDMMRAHADMLALVDKFALRHETHDLSKFTPEFTFFVEPSAGRSELKFMTVTLRFLKHEYVVYGPEMAVIMFAPEALKVLRRFVS